MNCAIMTEELRRFSTEENISQTLTLALYSSYRTEVGNSANIDGFKGWVKDKVDQKKTALSKNLYVTNSKSPLPSDANIRMLSSKSKKYNPKKEEIINAIKAASPNGVINDGQLLKGEENQDLVDEINEGLHRYGYPKKIESITDISTFLSEAISQTDNKEEIKFLESIPGLLEGVTRPEVKTITIDLSAVSAINTLDQSRLTPEEYERIFQNEGYSIEKVAEDAAEIADEIINSFGDKVEVTVIARPGLNTEVAKSLLSRGVKVTLNTGNYGGVQSYTYTTKKKGGIYAIKSPYSLKTHFMDEFNEGIMKSDEHIVMLTKKQMVQKKNDKGTFVIDAPMLPRSSSIVTDIYTASKTADNIKIELTDEEIKGITSHLEKAKDKSKKALLEAIKNKGSYTIHKKKGLKSFGIILDDGKTSFIVHDNRVYDAKSEVTGKNLLHFEISKKGLESMIKDMIELYSGDKSDILFTEALMLSKNVNRPYVISVLEKLKKDMPNKTFYTYEYNKYVREMTFNPEKASINRIGLVPRSSVNNMSRYSIGYTKSEVRSVQEGLAHIMIESISNIIDSEDWMYMDWYKELVALSKKDSKEGKKAKWKLDRIKKLFVSSNPNKVRDYISYVEGDLISKGELLKDSVRYFDQLLNADMDPTKVQNTGYSYLIINAAINWLSRMSYESRFTGIDNLTDEEYYHILTEKVKPFAEALSRLSRLNDFDIFLDGVNSDIKVISGVEANKALTEARDKEVGVDEEEGMIHDEDQSNKDSFMVSQISKNAYDTATRYVRSVLGQMVARNPDGSPIFNKIGLPVYESANALYNVLQDNLSAYSDPMDFWGALKDMAKAYHFVRPLVNTIEAEITYSKGKAKYNGYELDSVLFSSLFRSLSMRKQLYAVISPSGNGRIVNEVSSSAQNLASWRSNILNGIRVGDRGNIYYTTHTLTDEVKRNLQGVVQEPSVGYVDSSVRDNLIAHIHKYSTKYKDIWKNGDPVELNELYSDIVISLQMIGIDSVSPSDIKMLFEISDGGTKSMKDGNPLNVVIMNVREIIEHTKLIEKDVEDNVFSHQYHRYEKISKALRHVLGYRSTKSTAKLGGKQMSTYANPNSISSLIDQLSNRKNEGKIPYTEMLKSYSKYMWMSINGATLDIGLLAELLDRATNSTRSDDSSLNSATDVVDEQDLFLKKVALQENEEGKPYDKWSYFDRVRNNFRMFFSSPTMKDFAGKNVSNMVFIDVPTYSDAGSIEYISFKSLTRHEAVKSLAKYIFLEARRVYYAQNYPENLPDRVGNKKDYRKNAQSFVHFPLLDTMNWAIDREGNISIVSDPGQANLRNKLLEAVGGTPINPYGEGVANLFQKVAEQYMQESTQLEREQYYGTMGIRMTRNVRKSLGLKDNQKTVDAAAGQAKELLKEEINTVDANVFKPEDIDRYYRLRKLLMDISAGDGLVRAREVFNDITSAKSSNNNLIELEKKIEKIVNRYETDKISDAFSVYNANHMVRSFEISILTMGDLAYYDNSVEQQKRAKQNWSPITRINTAGMRRHAWDKTAMEYSITMADINMEATAKAAVEDIINKGLLSGISEAEKSLVRGSLKDNKITDGQSYRTLSSYREILRASDRWSPEMEDAYNEIVEYNRQYAEWVKNGSREGSKPNHPLNEMQRVAFFQQLKPYLYGSTEFDTGIKSPNFHVENATPTFHERIPLQHKNSESPMLAMLQIFPDSIKTNDAMLGILDAVSEMEENGAYLDVIHFKSSVKVGVVKDVFAPKSDTREEIKKDLLDYAVPNGFSSPRENPFDMNVVTAVDYGNYGIQMETKEHFINGIMGLGTQASKLIMSDMAKFAEVDISYMGESIKYNADDLYRAVTSAYTRHAEISLNNLEGKVGTNQELSNLLKEEVRKNPDKYNPELEYALEMDNNGKFRRPLFDPIHTKRIQAMLGSIYRDRLIKHKMPGGTTILASNAVFSDDLKVIYKEDGSLNYVEAYMPIYDTKLLEAYGDPDTGIIDEKGIQKIREERPDLLEVVGYRVPTEDLYSMVPIRIKGFFPMSLGSTAVLPADLINRTGWDFDIDKLYTLVPGIKNIQEDGSIGMYEMELNDGMFDIAKASQGALNNFILRSMFGILTSKSSIKRQTMPGGFEELKTLNDAFEFSELSDDIQDVEKALKAIGSGKKVQSKKEVKSFVPTNSLSAHRNIYFAQNNTVGKNLVSITAYHNVTHSYNQFARTVLAYPIEIDGISLTRFSKMIIIDPAREGNGYSDRSYDEIISKINSLSDVNERYRKLFSYVFVSRRLATLLAAAVDNAKDPILAKLGLTIDNANTFIGLIRLGFDVNVVAALHRLPFIKDSESYDRLRDMMPLSSDYSSGKKFDISFAEKLFDLGLDSDGKQTFILTTKNNMVATQLYNRFISGEVMSHEDMMAVQAYMNFAHEYYKEINRTMSQFDPLLKSARLDKSDTAIGVSLDVQLANTVNREMAQALAKGYYETDGFLTIDMSKEDFQNKEYHKPTQFMQMKQSLGVNSYHEMSRKNFLQFTNGGMNIARYMVSHLSRFGKVSPELLSKFFEDIITYYVSSIELFGNQDDLTAEDKRLAYLANFPKAFAAFKEKYPELSSNELLKNLTTSTRVDEKGRVIKVKIIELNDRMVKYTTEQQANITAAWEELFNSDNPEVSSFAIDLMVYNFYRGGMGFANQSFMYLAPLKMMESINGYNDALAELMRDMTNAKNGVISDRLRHFIDQFMASNNFSEVKPVGDISTLYRPDDNGGMRTSLRFKDVSGQSMSVKEYEVDGQPSYTYPVPYTIEVPLLRDSNGKENMVATRSQLWFAQRHVDANIFDNGGVSPMSEWITLTVNGLKYSYRKVANPNDNIAYTYEMVPNLGIPGISHQYTKDLSLDYMTTDYNPGGTLEFVYDIFGDETIKVDDDSVTPEPDAEIQRDQNPNDTGGKQTQGGNNATEEFNGLTEKGTKTLCK